YGTVHDSAGGQVTRWYRGDAVTPGIIVGVSLVAMGLLLWFTQLGYHYLLWRRLLPAAPVLVGACIVILQHRSGIGVRSDGVIVRSGLGTEQRVPWSEVEQFQ